MTPEHFMNKAARAAASARLLLDAGDVEGACHRAYYAMFNAAHAALLCPAPGPLRKARGPTAVSLLHKHLVRTGSLPAGLGKALNQVERARLLADYTGEEIGMEKARWAVEQAEGFVATVDRRFAAPWE